MNFIWCTKISKTEKCI